MAGFELLAAVAEVADGTLSLGETVERLLAIVVPTFADVATLDAVSERGDVERLGARVDGPSRTELELALMRRRLMSDSAVSSESRLLADEHLDSELLRALGLRSGLRVPLRARGQIVGELVCGVGRSGREYGHEDLRFAEVLA